MMLRPRQKLFVERSLAALGTRNNTLGVAPTASGKTLMSLGLADGVRTGAESDPNEINTLRAESVGSQHLPLRHHLFSSVSHRLKKRVNAIFYRHLSLESGPGVPHLLTA
jgi:hypothetical protein